MAALLMMKKCIYILRKQSFTANIDNLKIVCVEDNYFIQHISYLSWVKERNPVLKYKHANRKTRFSTTQEDESRDSISTLENGDNNLI